MKLKSVGGLFIAIGVLNLFRKVKGLYGFGGYVDNTWEILLISFIFIITGIGLRIYGKRNDKV